MNLNNFRKSNKIFPSLKINVNHISNTTPNNQTKNNLRYFSIPNLKQSIQIKNNESIQNEKIKGNSGLDINETKPSMKFFFSANKNHTLNKEINVYYSTKKNNQQKR